MPNVTIVSNRLPISVKKVDGKLEFYPSSGGLATGLASYVKEKKNKWIGWPGIDSDQLTKPEKKQIKDKLAKANCYPVFLTKKQMDDYYNGYSNEILWPVLHNMAPSASKERYWKAYREVNSLFAEAITSTRNLGTMVWVHDYHLMLVPKLIRESNKLLPVGFFLHTPFPTQEHFNALKESRSLIKGLLGSNMIGFHTSEYVKNFKDACDDMKIGTVMNDQIILADRTVKVGEFPIGIDYKKFSEAHKSAAVRKEVRKLKSKHRRKKVILTVDRLDPTKGFIERLKAYQALLKKNPKLHGKIVMVMLAIPSREDIKSYKQLKVEVEALVKKINKAFGKNRWQPINYMYKSVPFEQLSALYQVADVAFVAPTRDGMNLVAKEFIASKANKNGILVLSETTGAAEELRDAVLVNHARRGSLSKGLTKALSMPKKELNSRLNKMQHQLSNNTINDWVSGFMDTLQTPVNPSARTKQMTSKVRQQLKRDFTAARHRTLILDYDGTLVSLANDPLSTKPSSSLLRMLERLSKLPKTEVSIVSGRAQGIMDEWLGNAPITLVAEHGAAIRQKGKDWKELIDSPQTWKELLRPALEHFADNTPRAFVEEKSYALVWHYRAAHPYQAQKNLVVLKQTLRPTVEKLGLRMHSGKKIIEIKPPELNKGVVARDYLIKDHDFVLVMGDDYTDEDMIKAAPESAYTVKVGRGKTAAKYRLNDPGEVMNLLKFLLD